MATDRRTNLEKRAPSASFFALVQVLERMHPDGAPVGGLGPLASEAIRFRHDIQPVFHAGDVASLHVMATEGRSHVEVTTTFLGVLGSVSPLAHFFTDDVLRAEAQDDGALLAFYDAFHHRLIALFYRALVRSSPIASIRTRSDDRFTSRALALVGVLGHRRSESDLTPRQWLGRARVLGRRPRSRDALEAAIALALPTVRIRVEDFLARDLPLPDTERARLGDDRTRFGDGPRLGSHVLRQTGLLRLITETVSRATYEALLPGGTEHARLAAVVETIAGAMLDAELEIEIACGEEPRAQLGGGARLGGGALVAHPRTSRPLRVRVPLTDDAEARPHPQVLAP